MCPGGRERARNRGLRPPEEWTSEAEVKWSSYSSELNGHALKSGLPATAGYDRQPSCSVSTPMPSPHTTVQPHQALGYPWPSKRQVLIHRFPTSTFSKESKVDIDVKPAHLCR